MRGGPEKSPQGCLVRMRAMNFIRQDDGFLLEVEEQRHFLRKGLGIYDLLEGAGDLVSWL